METTNTPQQPQKPVLPTKLAERLYPVVLTLSSNQDFHKVNLREISSSSGISTSTLYRYYNSKEDMLFSILESKINEISSAIFQQMQGLESTREKMRRVFWVAFDYYDKNPSVAITAFITVPQRTWMRTSSYRDERARQIIADIVRSGKKSGEIDPAITEAQVADLYYMYSYRQIYRWYYHHCEWRLVDMIPQFFEVCWKAIKP